MSLYKCKKVSGRFPDGVTLPQPVPIPAWNPYPHLWVWVRAGAGMGTHALCGCGCMCHEGTRGAHHTVVWVWLYKCMVMWQVRSTVHCLSILDNRPLTKMDGLKDGHHTRGAHCTVVWVWPYKCTVMWQVRSTVHHPSTLDSRALTKTDGLKDSHCTEDSTVWVCTRTSSPCTPAYPVPTSLPHYNPPPLLPHLAHAHVCPHLPPLEVLLQPSRHSSWPSTTTHTPPLHPSSLTTAAVTLLGAGGVIPSASCSHGQFVILALYFLSTPSTLMSYFPKSNWTTCVEPPNPQAQGFLAWQSHRQATTLSTWAGMESDAQQEIARMR